jgi:hypothetical protein
MWVLPFIIEICLSHNERVAKLPSPFNLANNDQLESLHYEVSLKGLSKVVVGTLSTLVSSRITTIGLDVSEGLLRDTQEFEQWELLGRILASKDRFPRLSRIRIRLEPQFHWHHMYGLQHTRDLVHRAFPWAAARSVVLEVERLRNDRHLAVREISDDCYSTGIFKRATATF